MAASHGEHDRDRGRARWRSPLIEAIEARTDEAHTHLIKQTQQKKKRSNSKPETRARERGRGRRGLAEAWANSDQVLSRNVVALESTLGILLSPKQLSDGVD